jgi:hypothetical protein
MINGYPDIPVEKLKAHCEYQDYHEDHEVIKFFWEVFEEFTMEGFLSRKQQLIFRKSQVHAIR